MTTRRAWRRLAVVGGGLWLAGLGLLLAARIALTLDAPDVGLRIFAHDTGWAEAEHPVLAAVVSQLTASPLQDASVAVEGVRFEPLVGENGWWEGVIPRPTLEANAPLAVTIAGLRREVDPLELAVAPDGGAPPAMPGTYFQAPQAAGSRSVRLMDATAPGLHWDGAGTHCAKGWHAFTDGGSPARFVPATLRLWLLPETGAQGGVDVVLEPASPEPGFQRRIVGTSADGLAAWSTVLQGAERWDVSAPCPGGEIGRRTLVIAPSWSTIGVDRMAPTALADTPVRVQVSHQRDRGRWVLGLSCGGRWVGLEVLPVQSGLHAIEIARLRWPRTTQPRLCALHAAPSVGRLHEGVATSILLVPSEAEESEAWAALHGVITTRPEPHWRALGPVLADTDLANAPDLQTAVLDRLVVPPLRLPLMIDTREAWAEAHAQETAALRQRVDALLLIQLLLLLGLGLPTLWGQALRTRRRMQAVLEDDHADTPSDSPAGGMALPTLVLLGGVSAGATLIAAWRMLLYAMAG